MKAYKATKNGKCINITFEVGKTYTFNGELVICKQGFHFCQQLKNVINYYAPDEDVKIMEIEVLGSVVTTGDKSVTDKFKVIRFLSHEELPFVAEKDERGNMTYLKYMNVYGRTVKEWRKYDEKNNLTEYKDSYGHEIHQIYDERNNSICSTNEHGGQSKREYDERNNLIYNHRGDGLEQRYKYDESNNLIYEWDSNGYSCRFKYDKNNNKTHESDGWNEKEYTYDENNNVVHYKDLFREYTITIEGEPSAGI